MDTTTALRSSRLLAVLSAANEPRPDGMQGHHGPASGSLPPSAYVVVGMSPGETMLRVGDEDPLRIIVEQ